MKQIGYFLAGIAAIALGIVAGAFLLGFFAIMFIIALCVWACGVPITIKHKVKGGTRIIGYVRWFTYYTEQEWLMRHLR